MEVGLTGLSERETASRSEGHDWPEVAALRQFRLFSGLPQDDLDRIRATMRVRVARAGQEIPVKTPTNIHALLEFANGAVVNLTTSWDVWHHKLAPKESSRAAGDPMRSSQERRRNLRSSARRSATTPRPMSGSASPS